MPDDKPPDDDMETLSRAIVDAIMKSRDVRKAIRKLSETDESYAKSFMVLMLKVQNLADSVNPEQIESAVSETEREPKRDAPKIPPARKKQSDFESLVDGRQESPSERAFREFLASRFDQDEWLKKLGLIYD